MRKRKERRRNTKKRRTLNLTGRQCQSSCRGYLSNSSRLSYYSIKSVQFVDWPCPLIIVGEGAGDPEIPLAGPSEKTWRCHQRGSCSKHSVCLLHIFTWTLVLPYISYCILYVSVRSKHSKSLKGVCWITLKKKSK